MAEGIVCPKCRYVRKSDEAVPEWQCPSCQVVYAKAQLQPALAAGGVALPQRTMESLSTGRRPQEVRDNRNLGFGVAAGTGAALIGAVLWAVVTAVTHYKIGWMAVGVGALVGIVVRATGKGRSNIFGIAGAIISLFGCVAGNFLAVVIMASNQESVPLLELLSRTTPSLFVAVMTETFSPMDLLFYGLAVYEGFRFSIVRVEE
jgi:hypothetical protein